METEIIQRIYDIIDDIVRQKSTAVVFIVSNPVDILTYVAHKRSGWLRGRIIGSADDWQAARRKVADEVKHSAYHIIEYKGATWFAVGLALTLRRTEVVAPDDGPRPEPTDDEIAVADVDLR